MSSRRLDELLGAHSYAVSKHRPSIHLVVSNKIRGDVTGTGLSSVRTLLESDLEGSRTRALRVPSMMKDPAERAYSTL